MVLFCRVPQDPITAVGDASDSEDDPFEEEDRPELQYGEFFFEMKKSQNPGFF